MNEFNEIEYLKYVTISFKYILRYFHKSVRCNLMGIIKYAILNSLIKKLCLIKYKIATVSSFGFV